MKKIKVVPVAKIDISNKQFVVRESFIDESFSESIKFEGMLHPVILLEKDDGTYIIVSGYRRVCSAKKIGAEELEAFVINEEKASIEKLFRMAIVENVERMPLNPVEKGNMLIKLKREFGLSVEELAEEYGPLLGLGNNVREIKKHLKLDSLDEDLKHQVEEGKLAPKVAFNIADIDEESDRNEITTFVKETGRISPNELRDIIEKAKRIKIDNDLDSFREVFKQGQLPKIRSDINVDAGESNGKAGATKYKKEKVGNFITELHKKANPTNATKIDRTAELLEEFNNLVFDTNKELTKKVKIKKKSIEEPTIQLSLTIDDVEELEDVLTLLNDSAKDLLKELLS